MGESVVPKNTNTSSPSDGSAYRLMAWIVTVVGALFFFYEFIQMNMFNSLSASFQQAFHLSPFQIGLVSSSYFIADTILLYFVGVLLDRVSSRRLLIIGMLMCISGTVLIAVAHSAWFLVIARFLAGFASAFCLLSCLRIASQWFPKAKMARATGVVVTIGMLGGAVSQTPLTYLIDTFGWRHALLFVAGFGLCILALILWFAKDAPLHIRHTKLQSSDDRICMFSAFKQLFKTAQNWYSGLYITFMNLPIMLIAGLFGKQYMMQAHGLSSIHASTVSMMIFIGTIVGSSIFGFLSDWLGNRKYLMVAAATASLILFTTIILVPTQSYHVYVSAYFALGLLTSAQILGYPVAQANNDDRLTGSVLGFISIMIMGAPIILQPLFGYLLDRNWHGQMQDGIKYFHNADYIHALMLMVVTFAISIFLALKVRDAHHD